MQDGTYLLETAVGATDASWDGSGLAGAVTPTSASRTEPAYQDDDAKVLRS